MDDTSVAVSLPLNAYLQKDQIVRQKPLKYCERTAQVIPDSDNPLLLLLKDFEDFVDNNKMKVNFSKTKVMKFSRATSQDFPLEVYFSDHVILEEVHSFKVLGVILSNSLKWAENTNYICNKARKRIG